MQGLGDLLRSGGLGVELVMAFPRRQRKVAVLSGAYYFFLQNETEAPRGFCSIDATVI